MQRKFSIIIGAYNHGKTLPKLAEALNNQSFTDFDIHLCDDGSVDNTEWALYDNLHPLFKMRYHYHHQQNRGMRLSKNVNQGIKKATGEFCVFIMGDSFPEFDFLFSLNEYAKPGRILCGVRYHVDNGVAVDIDWRLKKMVVPPFTALLPAQPFNMITGNGLAIPTEAMRKYGGWDESIKGYGGDDQEIVARLYYKGYTVWSVADAKLYHHWHPSKSTADGNLKYASDKVKNYYYGR